MRRPIPAIDPVAIALDRIDAGPQLKFTGIDLETGAQVSVSVVRPAAPTSVEKSPSYKAHGRVLVLSIDRFKAAS
jgi:hypothetical protein